MKVIASVTNPGTTVAMRDIVPPDPVTGLPSDSSLVQDAPASVDHQAGLDDADE